MSADAMMAASGAETPFRVRREVVKMWRSVWRIFKVCGGGGVVSSIVLVCSELLLAALLDCVPSSSSLVTSLCMRRLFSKKSSHNS